MIARHGALLGSLIAALSSVSSAGMGPESCFSCPGMTWVRTECHFLWLSETPRIVHTLGDLPPEVVAKVDAHLERRLGRSFLSKLRFDQAHVSDPKAYYQEHPDWDRAKYPIPTYELAYLVTFYDEGPVEYCAKMEVDSSGGVIEEIDLPPVAGNPRLGNVVSLQEILNLAHSLGVPTDKAYLDMKYDAHSGSLEYLVSYYPEKPPPDYNKITLYIKAHDPKDYYWFKGIEMSSLDHDERPTTSYSRWRAPSGHR
jgi:hypothetical protein